MLAFVDLTLLMTLVLCSTQLLALVALRFARLKAAIKASHGSGDKSAT